MVKQTEHEGSQTEEVKSQKYSIGIQPDVHWESSLAQTKKENPKSDAKPLPCPKCALLEASLTEKDQLIASLGDKNQSLLDSNADLKSKVESKKHKAKKYKSHLKERESDLESLKKQMKSQTHSSQDSLKESRLRLEAEERIRQLTIELHTSVKESEQWKVKFEKLSVSLKQKRKMMLRELGEFVKAKNDFDSSFLTEYSMANTNGN
jgi:chromosome segregation ATPase